MQSSHDGIEQVARSQPMLSRNLEHVVEAQLIELDRPGLRPAIVRFVDGENGRRVRSADHFGDLLIAWYEAFASIHYEDKKIR